MDSQFRFTVVIIPAYNAAETLPSLFEGLWKLVEPNQVIVVDDGSQDATAEVSSKARVHVLRHRSNLGKGRALQTGFDAFLRTEFETAATMDADLQHRPEDLSSFVEVQRMTGADAVIGSRARLGTSMPFSRILSNTITSKLVSLRTGLKIVDSQCGYRLIRREVLEQVALESSGYEAETEFIIKSASKGFKIAFVPIKTVYANERSFMTNWKTTVRFVQTLMKDY